MLSLLFGIHNVCRYYDKIGWRKKFWHDAWVSVRVGGDYSWSWDIYSGPDVWIADASLRIFRDFFCILRREMSLCKCISGYLIQYSHGKWVSWYLINICANTSGTKAKAIVMLLNCHAENMVCSTIGVIEHYDTFHCLCDLIGI